MSAPRISVVIPVYNAGPFLREALDSLLAQTFGDFEAIAVNDGSTDNSLAILQEYAAKDSRIRILDGPNGGYGKAMNRGMDAASGKYMAILEPDDFLPREAYDILIKKAKKDQVEIVRATYCTFFEEEKHRIFRYVLPVMHPQNAFCPRQQLPGAFEFPPSIWASLYSLEFLRKYEIRFHETPGASYQDTGFFFMTMACAERCSVIDDVVYCYRTDNLSSSINTADKKRGTLVKEYDYIKDFLMCREDLWGVLKIQYYTNRLVSHLWMAERLSESIAQKFADELRDVFSAESVSGVPAYLIGQLNRFIQTGNQGELKPDEDSACAKYVVEEKFCRMYRKEMSAACTVHRFFSLPILKRQRRWRMRNYCSGIRAASVLENVYSFVGIPLIHRKIDIYTLHPRPFDVPAKVISQQVAQ